MCGLTFVFLFFTLHKYKEPLGMALTCYFSGTILFLCSNYMELLAHSPQWMIRFAAVEHLSISILALSWLCFSIIYTGYINLLKLRNILLILIMPVVKILLILSNSTHHLFWEGFSFVSRGNWTIMKPHYGPVFWLSSFYTYGLFGLGILLIVQSYIKGDSFYRKQASLLTLGFVFPFLVNISYIFKIFPGIEKDFSPVAFALTGLFFFLSVLWQKLLQLAPQSRDLLLEHLPVGVVSLDHKQRLSDFNQAAESIIGLQWNQLGSYWYETELSGIVDPFLMERPGFFNVQKKLSFRDRILEVNIHANHDEKAKLSSYMILIKDISLEDALLKEKNELIEKLEASNGEILKIQSRLIQQEKLAAIGQVAAGVAHEINNPVSYLKSNHLMTSRYLERLESSAPGDVSWEKTLRDMREVHDESYQGLDRITEVVKNLLHFSHQEREGKEQPYSLNEELEKTLTLLKHQIPEGTELRMQLGKVPEILCRGGEINQVIMNLTVNALQSVSDSKNPWICFRTGEEDGRIFLEISDNGNPIPPFAAKNIFEPFFTSKAAGEGTGLGLSLSRDIIEKRHHGRLFLKNIEEKVFRMEIPVDFTSF